jgi:hypothetical protein
MSAAAGFVPFFSVAVEHGYFADGHCPVLEWQPTPATARLLERAGCRTARSRGGLAVYADEARLPALRAFLRDERDPFCLTYRLLSHDSQFESYTRGIPSASDRVLFLTSAAAVAADTGDDAGLWRLHPDAEVGAAQYLPHSDERVAAVLAPVERLMRPAPVVQLAFGPGDAPGLEPVDARQQQGKRFCIRFAARATLWKYFLFGPWSASGVEVVDLARQVAFGAPGPESLPDGRAAVTVRSTGPIVLQQRPTQRFQLRSREEGQDAAVLIDRLPFASPGSLGGSEGGVPVSEIYV